MIEVTRLYCPASGAQPGDDNSTHHLAPTGYDGGTRCRYCGKAPATIRTEAERQRANEEAEVGSTPIRQVRDHLTLACGHVTQGREWHRGSQVRAWCPQCRATHDVVSRSEPDVEEDEETPVDVADRIVHDAKTRDLLRGAYALTHKIHAARQAPVTRARTRGEYLPDLMASREVLSTEIRRRARPVGMARARGLFIAPDGADQPTVWQDRRTQDPEALVRRCDVPEVVWDLLAEIIDHRSAEG